MGMGGMGGGFFSVDNPAASGNGFQAFVVDDELKLAPNNQSSSTPQSTTVRAVASIAPVQPIRLDVPEGTSAAEVWNNYFAKHSGENRADEAAVRQTCRKLMHGRRFTQVIAMIHAALGHSQAQPWMYEVLGLAMEANSAPRKEIERALMSAVDFSENAGDLMYVAQYMSRIGFDKRALSLFREVSDAFPSRPDPYLYGLSVAQRLDNTEAVQWATLGLLRQAWPRDQQAVEQKARRVATSLLERMRRDGQTTDADQFEAALKEATWRDCLVTVTWTGDADVDMSLEEPAGTICSLRNPRTTSGGVMVGDSYSRGDASTSVDGYREVYVCPEGFSGTYRMLLRRIWGQVTAGKVTVDICTNYGSENEKHIRKQIPLGAKDAMVIFDVPDGRRNDQLAEHQVASVARNQIAVNNAILAQQLNTLTDSAAVQQLRYARSGMRSAGGGNFIPNPLGLPLGRRGGVGFRPVLTTLPEGANMSATVVVSADRRYVRVTPNPLFSQILDVKTFNFATGGSGNSNGGNNNNRNN